MANYSAYIELSQNFESVVDLDAEERNPNLWQDYIVHDDMQRAVEKICDSIKYEIPDARRSFWIHGSYGTGKSYAAIVIKHLFEEPLINLEKFLSWPKLIDYRNKFKAIREKGEFLVVWKSGVTGVRSGIQLMMEMEMSIRRKLEEKFGETAYFGHLSLISAIQQKVSDPALNWQHMFNDSVYGISENHASFEEFKSEVLSSDLDACKVAAKICQDKGWALFATVDMFEDWLEDVIAGNHLEKSGIVFIWDEFTAFVRESGDDNILQRLSEFCKKQPFFMFLIVHIEPGWVANLGEETYKRILHRYHELEFHITESAAHELIGDSIVVRPAMEEQWAAVKNQLLKSIDKNIGDFDNLSLGNERERIKQLCPIHPMTLSLLAIVAQNFGASQRTLFRFMKDKTEISQKVGFNHFINNNGPDDWRWLTPDYLWDYFFTRESDIKGDLSQEARRCFLHFQNKQELVSADKVALHVFKAIMLLLAVMSTEKISLLRSQQQTRRMQATKNTLYKCFVGQLTQSDIDKYIGAFEVDNLLRMENLANGDARFELPYSGAVDEFEIRFDQIKKRDTRYELFKKGGIYSKSLEEKMWDPNRATKNRVQLAVSSSEKNSINLRKNELVEDLAKNSYKIGVLVVVPSEASQFASLQAELKEMAKLDTTDRLVICIIKEALTDESLDKWRQDRTHKELAAEQGLQGNANRYENEADITKESWAQSASESQIIAFYKDVQYTALYGKGNLISCVEKDVIFNLFKAAPELIVSVSTAFKKSHEKAALSGITLEASSAQINNIANGLKAAKAWDVSSINQMISLDGSEGTKAIASLAKFINDKLSQGAKVKLDELWVDLQKPPFGFYDCLACAYFLGYVLRFFKNGTFNWVDNSNNTFPLSENNLATLIFKLCRGDLINHTLSSGSEIWQQFKPYAQNIFKLSPEESTNEDQTRKYIRERIIKTGTPLWVIKYISSDSFGGADSKEIVCKIIDSLNNFISDQGDMDEEMSEIITLFKGRGSLRKSIYEAFDNIDIRNQAFRAFIFEKQPDLKDLVEGININPADLLDAIKDLMQSAIYTWSEDQVGEKLYILSLDYSLVKILNYALLIHKKSISAIKLEMANFFSLMKVPGSVIETLSKPWVGALKLMHFISQDGWKNLSIEEKKSAIDELNDNARLTWESLKESKLLLREYLSTKDLNVSDLELNNIFGQLISIPYDTSVVLFNDSIQRHINNIAYERDKKELLSFWHLNSGFHSVKDWCNTYNIPIQWVLDDDSLAHVEVVHSITEGRKVDNNQLKNSVDFLSSADPLPLKDEIFIQQKFLDQIGENNSSGYIEYKNQINDVLRNKLGSDIYAWGTKAGEVRNVIEAFIREKNFHKYMDSAKKKIFNMPVDVLRERVIKLLDDHPEHCKLFLDKE